MLVDASKIERPAEDDDVPGRQRNDSLIDPRLRTRDGIGIGSTYGELRSKYKVDSIGSGEGNFIARVEALGISFELDTSGPTPLWRIRDPQAVPAGVRIVGMLLTQPRSDAAPR